MSQLSSIFKILMPYNELRKDYLLDRWVVTAMERSHRPTDLAKPRPQIAKGTNCPMCAGNENMTPPAAMLFQKLNGNIKKAQDPLTGERPKDWLVRVIPNLYPAFSPPKQPKDTEQIFEGSNFGYAIGDHEVVVESPDHNEDPAEAELPQLELIINAYIDRFKELSNKPYVKYVSVFRNYGLEAGRRCRMLTARSSPPPWSPRSCSKSSKPPKPTEKSRVDASSAISSNRNATMQG